MMGNSCCLTSACRASGKSYQNSPQFYDRKFHNKVDGVYDAGAAWLASIKELIFGERVDPTPDQTITIQHFTGGDFYLNNEGSLRFSRLGHSTLLIQVGNKVWLTDPIFSERASVFQWLGPKRFHPAPIKIDELPPIEGVLISHNHYDHLDHDSIVKLKNRVKHFLAPLGIGEILVSWGVSRDKIIELDWWGMKKIEEIEIISTPAQNFSLQIPESLQIIYWHHMHRFPAFMVCSALQKS